MPIRQLIGVSDPAYLDRIATAAGGLGAVHALVVSARDGLDEMSTTGVTQVVEVRAGSDGAEPDFDRYTVAPADVGLASCEPDALTGGSPQENARITRAILAGETGPRRDIAVLNAAGAIYVAGRADSLPAGVRAAQAAIDDGRAEQTLERLRARSAQLAPA